MKKSMITLLTLFLLLTLLSSAGFAQKSGVIELDFIFPVQVAGPLARDLENKIKEFNSLHDGIEIQPVFGGNYATTQSTVELRNASGNPAHLFLTNFPSTVHFYDGDCIEPLDRFIERLPAEWVDDFIDIFWNQCNIDGQQWSIPYQSSTPIFYYNKDIFREAGLDPENVQIETWDDVIEYAKKLTVREGDVVKRWGVEIMVDDWGYQMLTLQAGQHIIGDTPYDVTIDTEAGRDAMALYNALMHEHKVAPVFRLYGDSAEDFVTGCTAMMWNTTGSLGFVRNNASFDWGVLYVPKKTEFAVPIGGGAIHIAKNIPETHKEAAWTFIEWMVNPENVAWWSVVSGYIPFRQSATEHLQEYWEEIPQAKVAFEQLVHAKKWAAFHAGNAVMAIINDHVETATSVGMDPAEFTKRLQNAVDRTIERFLD